MEGYSELIMLRMFGLCVSRGVFQSLVQKHFPLEKPKREKTAGNKRKRE